MSRYVKRSGWAVAACVAVLGISACGGSSDSEGGGASAGCKSPRIALIINSNLGDGGFFDEANGGVTDAAKKLGICAKTIETGPQPTKWAPAVTDVSSGSYDAIIAGSFEMKQLIEQAAQQHPDKKFVLFDIGFDAKACGGCKNIFALTIRYEESGFLAGALATLATTSSMPRTNPEKVVGFVGGQEIPVIQNYRRGFIAGVKAVDPSTKVLSAYAGSFSDPVKGKQLTAGMIDQGADIVFTAAGATDKGVFQGVAAGGAWAIGNSVNQATANVIDGKPTVLTATGGSYRPALARTVEQFVEGAVPFGTIRTTGVDGGSIYTSDTPTYRKNAPKAIRDKLAEIEQRLENGELKVDGP